MRLPRIRRRPGQLSRADVDRLRLSVHPLGRIFISYRQSDGTEAARIVAWQLRSVGLPVWLDEDDLPPGETLRRLEEALSGGLSAAVLVVTPEIALSKVVREFELPRLLAMARASDFALALANTIPGGDPGKPDYSAPDRLLGPATPALTEFSQYPLFGAEGASELARGLALRRMESLRVRGTTELEVDVSTRTAARAFAPHSDRAGLLIRTQPPARGRRAAGWQAWQPLVESINHLPGLVDASGVSSVRFRGNAHLSVGFALGTALPVARPWRVSVEPRVGEIWVDADRGTNPDVDVQTVAGQPGGHLAIIVDCVPHEMVGHAFGELVSSLSEPVAAAVRVVVRRHIPPEHGADVANAVAAAVRSAAAAAGTSTVHLALRTPMPVALLLGRRLNTLEVTLYEWEDGSPPARYIRMATVSAGRGPILSIHPDPS